MLTSKNLSLTVSESIRACLSSLSSSDHLAGKRCILVGAKSDLVRSRLVSPSEGTSAAIQHGVKFTEISAGLGCNIDSLLVGIVLQCRSVVRTGNIVNLLEFY